MKSSSLCPKGFISSFLLYFLNFRAATAHDIKVAYRRLALELHPDVNNSCPTKSEEFKLAAQAYETLSDHSQRSRYDQQFFGHRTTIGILSIRLARVHIFLRAEVEFMHRSRLLDLSDLITINGNIIIMRIGLWRNRYK